MSKQHSIECRECKKRFLPFKNRKTQIFCSKECRSAYVRTWEEESIPDRRVCTKCEKEKPIDQFHNDKRMKHGKHIWCAECRIEKQNEYKKTDAYKAYMKKTKEHRLNKNRVNDLRSKYGLTVKEHDEILASQGFKCAICRTENPGGRNFNKRFQVDHCHETGRVRGLICWSCNVGLGKLGDTVESLERAVEYLKGLPTLEL